MGRKSNNKLKKDKAQSISKQIFNAVLLSSIEQHIKKENSLDKRLREIQRRYGIGQCLILFPEILHKINAKPSFETTSKDGKPLKIPFVIKPIEDWLSSFQLDISAKE